MHLPMPPDAIEHILYIRECVWRMGKYHLPTAAGVATADVLHRREAAGSLRPHPRMLFTRACGRAHCTGVGGRRAHCTGVGGKGAGDNRAAGSGAGARRGGGVATWCRGKCVYGWVGGWVGGHPLEK